MLTLDKPLPCHFLYIGKKSARFLTFDLSPVQIPLKCELLLLVYSHPSDGA